MPIWAVKVTAGRELFFAERISEKAKRLDAEIYSVVVPFNIRGFVFVEGSSYEEVVRVCAGERNFKGLIKQPIPLDQMDNIIGVKEVEIEVNPGDIVELIAGPFVGERAKVIRTEKDKVVIELMDAAIPVQITVGKENIKVVKKKEE